VRRTVLDDTRVLTPSGELDGASVPVLEVQLMASIKGARTIVLDLGDLDFIDSCGLWLVTLTSAACKQAGVDFALLRGPEAVHSVFEVTGLSDVLPFRHSPGLA
jgi:anti-sigma B factor antagonist